MPRASLYGNLELRYELALLNENALVEAVPGRYALGLYCENEL